MESQLQEQSVQADYDEHLERRAGFVSRDAVLELALGLSAPVPGHILEFGVYNGESTRFMRRALTRSVLERRVSADKRIYGFDSFEGLPEKYENAAVGAFACAPPQIAGVTLVKGYFETSLTAARAQEIGAVSFASLDADLYSSTLCALRWLTPMLSTGSLLLFDEFLGEKESEKRAFELWQKESGIATVSIARFGRAPSGWGKRLDQRALYQVVGRATYPSETKLEKLRRRVLRQLGVAPR